SAMSSQSKVCKGPAIGVRHLQSLLLFLGLTVMHIARLNVSVAIVAMTNAESTNPDFPEHHWTERQKSYILSSFYWGYILTLCPGSFLCRRFGAKVVLFIASCGTAIFSFVTPSSIAWGGWQVFCGIRIVQGLFQGVIFPAVTEHLAVWSPPEERNRLGAFSYTGSDCGTVLAMFISGMIAKGPLGWPGISYVSGALCGAWCILWLICGANNATESRFISDAECKYIESSLQHSDDFHARNIPIPWRAICTSIPFLALLAARCSETYGLSTLQAEIPSYMNGVLQMDIQSNAVFSSLPFLTMWMMSYVYLIIADVLLRRKWLSLTSVRKLFNTIAFWLPAAGLIAIGFLSEENTKMAIALMTISVGINAGSTIGSTLNTIDLSPNHAGFLMGFSNTVANVIPILTPLIAGLIVVDKHDASQWRWVFVIAAGVYFTGNSFFLIFGRTSVQSWNEPPTK
ncbi:CG3649, partial [Drosophila busckii]